MRILMILLAFGALAWGQTAQPLRLEKTIELPDVQGRIDHLSIDLKGERLFVAALGNNTVEVIDIKGGKTSKDDCSASGAPRRAFMCLIRTGCT